MKAFRPEHARALDPEEFARVFATGVQAGERPQDTEAFAEPGAELVDGDGMPVQMSDTPYNRAGFALKRLYGDDREGFASALARFRALMDLITREALGEWARSSIRRQGTLRLHPAVLDVASEMRPSKNGRFPRKKFLQAVAATARERYPQVAEWQDDEDGAASPRDAAASRRGG